MWWIVTAIGLTILIIFVPIWYLLRGTDQINKILIHRNKQIWFLIAIIVLVFIWFTAIEYIIWENWGNVYNTDYMNNSDDTNPIFLLYSIFYQTEKIHQISPFLWIKLFYVFVSLIGSILFTGMFIATITNSFQRRIEDSEKGRTRYSKLRNHDVIIGSNEILAAAILFLAEENKENKFVVVTNGNIEMTRRRVSKLEKNVLKRVIIYKSDILNSDYLNELCLKVCCRTVILGDGNSEGNDAANVATLKQLHKHIKDKCSGHNFRCYISYFDDNMLLNYCCNDKYADGHFNIYPFNFYEQWTDKIWGYGQLYNDILKKNENKSLQSVFASLTPVFDEATYALHIVVIGFSTMAIELVKTAVKVAHFAGYNEQKQTGKTLITIITDDKSAVNRFQVKYRLLSQVPDVDCEYENCDINSADCYDLLSRYAASEYDRLYLAICSNETSANITLANNLPSDIYKYSIPTLVYQKEFTDAEDCYFNKHLRNRKNIQIFGAYNSYVNLDGALEEAMALRYCYRNGGTLAGDTEQMSEKALNKWFGAHWDNTRRRWLATVNAMHNMMTSAHLRFVNIENQPEIDNVTVDQFKDAVASVVQYQYIAWNILAGYMPGDITKASEWTLKKVNTLYPLSILVANQDINDSAKERIKDVEDECKSILCWLKVNNFELKKQDNG